MKSEYVKRSLLTALGVLTLSFAFIGIVFSFFAYRMIRAERTETIDMVADTAKAAVYARSIECDINSLDMMLTISAIADSVNARITLCSEDGTVVACSDGIACAHIGTKIPDAFISKIGDEGYTEVTSLGDFYEDKSYVAASRVKDVKSDELIGYLLVAQTLVGFRSTWRSMALMFIIVAAFVLVIAGFGSFVTTKRQSEPLSKMAHAAHNFARGDFSERIGDTGRKDEVGELAEAFDAMADALEKSEKLRKEFVANVSHELKTPMTTISGFADGILDGTIPDEKKDEYLKTISSECRRLSRLVTRMLDISRMQEKSDEEKREKFDIVEQLIQVVLSLEGKINSRGLDVDMQLPEEAVYVYANSDSITQVIYNIIDNAVKFADEGGKLGVSLWKSGKKANVSIRDTGQTIPPEELPLIFDRFHKADPSRGLDREGAGLGLYIVKTILNNHGEDIYVKSENGVTEFTFTLALA